MALTASVGWYASDDGLVLGWNAPHRKAVGDKKRFWMDYEAISEIVAGDTIDMNVTPTVVCAGLTIANVGQNASILTRIEADISAGTVETEYSVVFTVTLTSGAIIARVGTIRVSAI